MANEVRKLNINYSKKRTFKKNNKPENGEKILRDSDVFKNGAFNKFVIGAKYCLPTNKLDFEQINQLKDLFGEGEEKKNLVSSFGINESGWLGTTFDINDICGNDPVNDPSVISPALSKYREFAKSGSADDLFISSYGNSEVSIDFSKLNMCQDPDTGDIFYPYGVMFFSDNKHMNQFEATVACLPKRYENIKNKKNIKPITCDNWTDSKISCNFTRHGYLVIFYVTDEILKEENRYHPVVTSIVIELVAKKDYKTSEISGVYVGKVKTETVCTPDVTTYIVDEIYKKYSTNVEKSNVKYCMIDWIYSIGDNPKNYDLTLEDKIKETEVTEFKSNLSFGNKRRVVTKTNVESQVEEEVEEESDVDVDVESDMSDEDETPVDVVTEEPAETDSNAD